MTTLTAFDLERVEVLKGPQGTLFGSNAAGGAINFVAAKPTQELAAGVTLGYGRFDRAEASGFISGSRVVRHGGPITMSITEGVANMKMVNAI